jgi:hypothetical protein
MKQHAWMGSPLFHGKYPDIMRTVVDANSADEGLTTSRLPTFDDDWTKRINGNAIIAVFQNYITIF